MKKSLLAVTLLMATLTLTGCFKKATPIVVETTPEPATENVVTAITYPIDLQKSTMSWTGRKTLIKTEHNGTVALKFGQVMLSANKLVGGSFIIDMATLSESVEPSKEKEGLEKHLKSEDFFDVVKYPEATLTIKSASLGAVDNNQQTYNVTADLTIKGVTNAINFEAQTKQENGVMTATAAFSIDRTLWGIKYGSGKFFSDLGDKIIDDTIDFQITIEAPVSTATTPVTSIEEAETPAVVDITTDADVQVTTEVVPAE